MLSIPVKSLREGMVVGQSIYSKAGAAYLVKGKPLTNQYIKQMKKIGIPSISVSTVDPRFEVDIPGGRGAGKDPNGRHSGSA